MKHGLTMAITVFCSFAAQAEDAFSAHDAVKEAGVGIYATAEGLKFLQIIEQARGDLHGDVFAPCFAGSRQGTLRAVLAFDG